ncbi:outer membrane receptor protein involved in Fe transport [Caulobacter ginsengisoli]|uniref:Outer membrane receptor protein involved in Fe transport n=1 Tax=Caulobacter ginsengisoli TaxID=400775 RepID=A0ABU0IWS5_9CAUL|nr:TonB-dependent receptor [Caulobacter ginsengisoli]MDQ0465825.1 outer membrane receptor protein involved in Fe transport [Caulobacter ginsengisoli]
MRNSQSLRAFLALGVCAGALLTGGEALAQTPVATPPPADAAPTVDTIIVTAQRREETANSVGMGIQAFKGDDLETLRVTDAKDLSTVAPSFSVSQGYQGVPIYTLRGIGFNTINLSATSTVGTYVDEVAYAYPFMNTGPLYDLERVEVLKGPQGTLYGRNTTAGLIDFVTRKPTETFAAGVTGELGNYRTRNFDGFISGPLGDKAQGRLAFRSDDSDEGWQVSNTRGERLGEIHRWGARGTLALQPADGFDVELSLSGWRNNSDTLAAQAIGFTPNTTPGGPSPVALFNAPGLASYVSTHMPTDAAQADWAPASLRTADIGTGLGIHQPLKENDDFYAGRLKMTWDVGDNMRLVSLTGYNRLTRDATFDWSGAPYDILIQRAEGEIKSVSEELRLEGDSDRGHWLVGGYYGRDEITDGNRTLLGDNANVGFIRFYTATLLGSPFNTGGYTPLQASQAFRTYEDIGLLETTTWSLYANADWKLTDSLKLTTGLRYTQDKQDFEGCSRDFNSNMLPNVNVTNRALFFGVYGLVAPITQGQCVTFNPATASFGKVSSTLDEDNIAWRLGLDWTPAEGTLLYASISRGAKAGDTPINAANISTQDAPARQELLLAYEGGIKTALFERRVQLNAALFYYDYEDKQLSVYFADPIYTALARLSNIPNAKAYGLDTDVTWRVNSDLTAIVSATWLHTELEQYIGINGAGAAQDFTGASFPYSPKFQGSATLIWSRPITDNLGVQAAVNGRYQTRSHADLGEDPRFALKSYGLLSASFGVHSLDDRWELSVWGRNLTDEYYWNSVASNANLVVRFPAQPKTYGMSLTFKY